MGTIVNALLQAELQISSDANKSEDYYPVKEKDIIRTAMFKIKYIGYPAVWLNEKLK